MIGLAVVSFVRRSADVNPVSKKSPPKVSVQWAIDAEGARWLSFSSDGGCFCTVDASGTVRLYSSTGNLRYATKVLGVTRAVVSPDGRMTMAYSLKDPTNRVLTFLDSQGRPYWKLNVSGAVWSADVAVVDGRSRFVAGTGEKYIYVVDVGGRRKRYRRWRTGGAVVSCAISEGGGEVTFGTWQSSTVARADDHGKRDWESKLNPSDLHQVEPLGSSPLTFVRSVPNRPGDDGEYSILDEDGAVVLRGEICAEEKTKVLVAPNGQFVCLGCSKLLRHEGKSLLEKHAVLLDSSGDILCDKGSPFLQVDPILVTSGGFVLLRSAKNSLFSMSPSGELRPILDLKAPVVRHTASRDGSHVILHCSDGKLYMISAI